MGTASHQSLKWSGTKKNGNACLILLLGSERNINSKRAAGNFPEFLKLHSENIQSEKGLPEMTN